MRKLVITEFLTLDGVMQAPGGKSEDTEDGFEYGGWQMGYFDEVGGQAVVEVYNAADTLLLGRKTYDIFAGYWPTSKEEPFSSMLNGMKKYVASKTLKTLSWQNSFLLKDVVADIKKLKEENGKNILVAGSGDFAQTLMKNGLVDEYALFIHPLTLGKGKRLFGEGSPMQKLSLKNSKVTKTGIFIATYIPKS